MFQQKYFNIAGPCNPARHYMLPPLERLPQIKGMIEKGQCFVVHAQRQCGKTTAFCALTRDINLGNEAVALYCSLEVLQAFPKAKEGLGIIYERIRKAARENPGLAGAEALVKGAEALSQQEMEATGIASLLSGLARALDRPLVVFFDEVDCLSGETLITFLRQLRDGYISAASASVPFPMSIALIGMRNIRDYKADVRADAETLGSASPFNVIVKATALRVFTEGEMRELYMQHTRATGQIFEEKAIDLAWKYSQGQPYLANALARWCVEEIHKENYSLPVTGEEMQEAVEKIIRERGTHLDSLMERLKESRVRSIIEPVMLGEDLQWDDLADNLSYVMDLGLLINDNGVLKPANPIYAEVMGRYLSWGRQQDIRQKIQSIPWVKDEGLDMRALMMSFQQFWRENADESAVPYEYHEAYPQLVLQAFLQRVVNGGGEIIREMALGKRAMDIGIRFRGNTYAIECKKKTFYEKSHEKAYNQITGYLDRLGVNEGWLVVFDSDLSLPWENKIFSDDLSWQGKVIHLLGC